MRAFLFAWNPVKWPWPGLSGDIRTLRETGILTEAWSCASKRSVRMGDRAFLVRVGKKPTGLMGSGYISSEPFESERNGIRRVRVTINFEVLLDPETEPILGMEELRSGVLKQQLWSPQASGISIKPHVAFGLEEVWNAFLSGRYSR
jgi:hypothetical protein